MTAIASVGKIDIITDVAGTGGPDFPDGVDVGSAKPDWDRRFLSANVTTTGAVADWTFYNLEAGKVYEISISHTIQITQNNRILAELRFNSTRITRAIAHRNFDAGAAHIYTTNFGPWTYVPSVDGTLTFFITEINGELSGNDTNLSWIQVEEVDTNIYESTPSTKWD